jgi:hypothetical protein
MSVIVTLRMNGDPAKLEQYAAANPDAIKAISERGRQAGAIAHRFYGADDQIMVVDEWPDAESFNRFFEANSDQIGPLMAEVGVTGPPEVLFWRKLNSGDDIGWGA